MCKVFVGLIVLGFLNSVSFSQGNDLELYVIDSGADPCGIVKIPDDKFIIYQDTVKTMLVTQKDF